MTKPWNEPNPFLQAVIDGYCVQYIGYDNDYHMRQLEYQKQRIEDAPHELTEKWYWYGDPEDLPEEFKIGAVWVVPASTDPFKPDEQFFKDFREKREG